jgi:hypothetical protein
VSGIIIGTLFTLFVVPSIYVLVARTHVAEQLDAVDGREDRERLGGAVPVPDFAEGS